MLQGTTSNKSTYLKQIPYKQCCCSNLNLVIKTYMYIFRGRYLADNRSTSLGDDQQAFWPPPPPPQSKGACTWFPTPPTVHDCTQLHNLSYLSGEHNCTRFPTSGQGYFLRQRHGVHHLLLLITALNPRNHSALNSRTVIIFFNQPSTKLQDLK